MRRQLINLWRYGRWSACRHRDTYEVEVREARTKSHPPFIRPPEIWEVCHACREVLGGIPDASTQRS